MVSIRSCTYNLKQILAQCKSDISIEEKTGIIEKIPHLAKILGENGELVDTDFEKYNIRNNDTVKSKDNLVISRRRMVLLTNPTLVQSEEAKRQKKISEEKGKQDKKRIRKEKAEENKENRRVKANRIIQTARVLQYDEEDEVEEED